MPSSSYNDDDIDLFDDDYGFDEEYPIQESKGTHRARDSSVPKKKSFFRGRDKPKKPRKERKQLPKSKKLQQMEDAKNNKSKPLFKKGAKRTWYEWILFIVFCILYYTGATVYYTCNFIFGSISFIISMLVIAVFLVIICGSLLVARVYPLYQQGRDVAYEKLTDLDVSKFRKYSNTEVFDKDNQKIGEIDAGDYQYIEIKNISKYIQNGYIAQEDKRFKEHPGIDLQALLRAGVALVRNDGEITQGGSTITQQVIKNNMLTQEQSYERKIAEIFIAPYIDTKLGKSKIMEIYCNTNFYGNNCYGVEKASQYYFGKSSKDLSLGEAAMLVGISNNPNKANPITNMDLALKKMKQVLKNMYKEGYISKKQYKKAVKKGVTLHADTEESASSDNYMLSYALYCATLEEMERQGFQFKYTFTDENDYNTYKDKYGQAYGRVSQDIRQGGYKIYTSIDQGIQNALQTAVDSGLANFTEVAEDGKYALQGSAVCVDNNTQYVVAIVGGRGTQDQYNRGFLATRQPGSCIKPLLSYGPAVDNGIVNGSSIVVDEKVYAVQGDDKSYSPNNADFSYLGSMTVREALARSRNTIAYKLYNQVGKLTAISYLGNMHFSSLSNVDNTVESLPLGGFTNGAKVCDMAKGYATLENHGAYSDRTCIRRIEHDTEGVLYKEQDIKKTLTQVYSPDTAFIMTDMLQGVFKEDYGTAHRYDSDDQIYAGKTGTTDDNKDAWFCGYSKYYTTSVWVGYDQPHEMSGIQGGTYPLRIWKDFMTVLHTNLQLPKADFDRPDTAILKKVTADGSLSNKKYKMSKLKTGEGAPSLYSQRPAGYDYYSVLNQQRFEAWEKEKGDEEAQKEAEFSLIWFEEWNILTASDAMSVDAEYADLQALIEKIQNDEVKKEFRKRAAKKYELLSGDIKDNWQKEIDEQKAAEQEQRENQYKIDAENSVVSSQKALEQARVTRAQWFIDKLNSRQYNTDVTQQLLMQAQTAVDRCAEYDAYESLSNALQGARTYVQTLPTQLPTSSIPATDDDYIIPNDDNYVDILPTPTPTPMLPDNNNQGTDIPNPNPDNSNTGDNTDIPADDVILPD